MKKSEDLLSILLEKYGEDSLVREYADGHPSISTGSVAIDISTGVGGIPVGRYTEIYGPESGGKTTLCLSICKQALLLGFPVLYIDVENSLDFGYAKDALGSLYNKKNVIIIQPDTAEDAFTIAESGIDNKYRCIIFDSIASISPETEQDAEYGKQAIGISPRLTNQFLKKTKNKIRETESVFVITNQVRANIGAYMGGYTTPAGYALKHYMSLIIYVSKGQAIEDDSGTIGSSVSFVIKKNKVGIPYRQAETNIIYGKGIDYVRDVIKFASLVGVLKSRGSYLAFEDATLGQGLQKTIQYLSESKETLDKIVEMCYTISKVQYPPIRPVYIVEEE